MKTAQLGDVFEWDGQIVKCEWINEGEKSIGFRIIRTVTCPHCERDHEIVASIDVIESSPMFQTTAKPVPTLTNP